MSKRSTLLKKRDLLSISAAVRILKWYQSPSGDSKLIANLLNQEMMEATFHVRGGFDIRLVLKRQLESEDFPTIQKTLLDKWQHKVESLSVDDAEAFCREFAENVDHEFLFAQDVSVGLTRASRLFPASDFVTAYHAQRTPWTLHLTVQGAADYTADTRFTSSPHEILLIAPNASLHYKRRETTPKWKHYWAIFRPRPNWMELMDWQMVTFGIYGLTLKDDRELVRIRSLFAEMVNVYSTPTLMTQRLIENLLEQVLIRANSINTQQGLQRTDPRVLRACKFIEEHAGLPIAVSDVAAHCAVSESRLAHLFKDQLAQSVKGFIDAVRIQRAQRLLATTTDPIAVIGAKVGYADPSLFSKFFKRKLNYSPREFRNDFGQSS